jgi:fatty acid desaturase
VPSSRRARKLRQRVPCRSGSVQLAAEALTMTGSVTPEHRATSLPGAPNLRAVVSNRGEPWLAFRRTLKPKYAIIWRDIALCHLMIFGALAAQCAMGAWWGEWVALLAAPPAGLWIGYWMHSLSCFGHEATHFTIAPKRSVNDFLANWFVMSLSGLEVKLYRKIHWSHHLHLGDLEDTQVYYREHPSPLFLLEVFTGVRIVKTLWRHKWGLKAEPAVGRPGEPGARFLVFALARTAAIHLTILAAAVYFHYYGAAAAWLVGLVTFVAIGTLRQLLEHRALDADPAADYKRVEHGPVNRMFANGFFSRTLGNAGFNRHLLHHWDPSISYTCFDEMEAFLMRTPLAAELAAARTTYWATLLTLMTGRKACRPGAAMRGDALPLGDPCKSPTH